MPKRNIVWILVGAVIALLLWKIPESHMRRDTLYRQLGPLLDARTQILKRYVEPVEEDVLLEGAIDGMLYRLDPYSDYFTEVEYDQFDKRAEGQFFGIGVELIRNPAGGLIVVSPIEGSPAFLAGLRANDRIRLVNNKPTADMTFPEAVKAILGPPGSNVTLTIYRPLTDKTFKKTITRSLVEVLTIRGWSRSSDWEWDYLIDPHARIGYVRISSFERHTTEQLDPQLKELLARHGMRALILDVRDNPGGLLPVVVDMINRFVPEGLIVSTKGRDSPEQPYLATREHTYDSFPIVVLVNKGSASASEILAGALKDHKRATIVGEPTFGKGSVQEVVPLKDQAGKNWGAIKLTTAYYYLPKGERIHGRGVIPDRIVELTPEQLNAFRESQRVVYSTELLKPETQPATTTKPKEDRVSIMIDPQLKEALTILRKKLATQPAL